MDGRSSLLNRMVIESRPESGSVQNITETETRILATLNEALADKVIDDELLTDILVEFNTHLSLLREHDEVLKESDKDFWELHGRFCSSLNGILSEQVSTLV